MEGRYNKERRACASIQCISQSFNNSENRISQNDEMSMGKSAAKLHQRSVDGRVDVADSHCCLKRQVLAQTHESNASRRRGREFLVSGQWQMK